jgi:hypothetical protein
MSVVTPQVDFPTALRLPCRGENHGAGLRSGDRPRSHALRREKSLAPIKGTVAIPNGKMVFSSPCPAVRACLEAGGRTAESGTMENAFNLGRFYQ